MIRIANGQGFWGDWLEAPVRLVNGGPLDYLTLDYLAEVTMSILQKQRKADPNLGYARDFPPLVARIARQIRDQGIRLIANAGGVNPIACAREVRRLAPGLRVAVVLGDDLMDHLDELMAGGHELRNIDTGEPLAGVRSAVQSANAYIGAFPLAEALRTGANIVITGRCADAALALAPMIHEFGWTPNDWNLLAAGVIAGHVIECGAQATGGNCHADWQSTPDFAHIGYPIIEADSGGTMAIAKHENTGGRVTLATVKEQLVYEIGDPRRYMTPDVIADFTSIQLQDDGPDRVRITGAEGRPRPDTLKVSLSYHYGWKATGTLVYSAPDALAKARVADDVVRQRLADLGLQFEKIHTEFFGVNACHGHLAPRVAEPAEVQLRIGVRDRQKAPVERFTRELIPLVLSGPPTATGYGEGRPPVREIVAYWPTLVRREMVRTRVEVVE
ncbi:MAG TPA: acyclic terpene utilization AtuA family protein [Bryobacteraceae bacterium]|nr:acyclic terpene utilization AtuA family protein [Bryobacteraceae bacterium]HXR77633.1 acyclic terpene utilization AtuA family protein [Bryobacteraceae bacterium]